MKKYPLRPDYGKIASEVRCAHKECPFLLLIIYNTNEE